MRRLLPITVFVLVALSTACGVLAPPPPTPPPAPTPTSLKPAILQTPRPTLPAKATELPMPTAVVAARTAVPATATPEPSVRGTPVSASEPLLGLLLDDRVLSPIIGQSFPYRVYLPPDYLSDSQRHYPVLYMLHGAGGNYTEWTDSFLPEQADRMMAAREIPPLIIVMPDDGGGTYWANWSEGGPRWADYLTDDVVATVDQRYRTLPNASSRAIGGLSMGGLGALNLAFQHPDVFGVVGAHSPSVRLEPDPALWFMAGQTFWDNNPIWLAQHGAGMDSLKIWVDAGTDDVWLPNIEAVHDALVEQGIHLDWHLFAGEHEAEYWIAHVPDYMHFYAAALQT